MTRLTLVSNFITSRPVAILMVFLAAVVFGFMSYFRLPLTLMPELTYPTLTVRTEYAGAAPEEVENDISRPIEEQLGVIAGLSRISSISRAGISDVVLEFTWDTEMGDATQDVLEKLDMVFLPTEADRPLILHYDPSLDPVMELSLSGEGRRFEGESGLRRLRRLAELQVKKELEPVKGVAAVRVRGGLEEEIHVLLEEEALRRTNISIRRVIDRLAQENINVAGGTLKEGRTEYLVRTLNEYTDIEQIGETIVASFDGRDVRLKDLGQVKTAHKEREILTRTDGKESVQLEIYKEGDANIVALAQRVKRTLGQLRTPMPGEDDGEDDEADDDGTRAGPGDDVMAMGAGLAPRLYREEGAKLEIAADRSLFIESSIRQVRNTAVFGGVLAVLILYLFVRNVKSTAIIAISIPISLLITFAPLHLLGVSLNIMSLGGLALGIGMLVDSSIVVLESIHRCREEGDDHSAAAVRGTTEVRTAVVASTLTSIAVFFPMVFVEGIAGQAFGDLGFAVVISLLAAAAVALFFIPMLASRKGFKLDSLRWSYFDSAAWKALRERYAGWPLALKIAGAPLFVAMLLLGVGIHFALTVLNGIRGLVRAHFERLGSAWRELRGDFGAAAVWVKVLAAPFWIFRLVLLAPVPYAFHSGAWRAVRSGYGSSRFWVRCLLVPFVYWTVRFVVGTLFEGVGLLILFVLRSVIWVIVSLIAPVLAVTLGALFWIPLRLTSASLRGLNRAYPPLLRKAMAHPLVVVLVVVACFWATWQTVRGMGSELLPEVHQGEFTVAVALPVGTPLEETVEVLSPIEEAILDERRHIRSMILTLGYDSTNSQRSDEGEHTARFKILLEKSENMALLERAVIARLRERFDGVPDLDARIERPVLFSSKTPIEVEVQGDDLRRLKDHADRVAEVMAALPELADVETSLRRGAPEVQIVYDRNRLSRYNLNVQQVAELVRSKVKGFEATRFNLQDRRIPIIVRLALDDRETVEDINGIIINPGGERPIRLAAVAQVVLGEGPSEVRRIDGQRVAVVGANIALGSLSTATFHIRDSLMREIEWPSDMSFYISGQNAEWQRSQTSLWIALALSVFLVYVIMASQFESLIHPLVIMLTIPLALFGTVITLKLLGLSLSIVVFLGMIMLAGIVVNNAIVFVDYINTLRRRGMSRDEAVVTAGSVRLRPILMTTATTVLGLTPMALGLGDGAEIRTPMAIAVISGLISSTALTLLVIPSIYVLADRLKQKLLGTETVAGQVSMLEGAPAAAGPGADTVTP